ncbi:hypothetical protein GQA12_26520 [Paenibacillus alvei]|nr:hypothetical protein [Paenibacillus alvei]
MITFHPVPGSLISFFLLLGLAQLHSIVQDTKYRKKQARQQRSCPAIIYTFPYKLQAASLGLVAS